MTDVVVVGGGIVGSSVAYRLARSGAAVTLVESGHLASGTSSTSFAWLNANSKPPFEYHRLNVGGMGEHHVLREEFGHAPWLHTHGNAVWDFGVADPAFGNPVSVRIDRSRQWGYPVEVLSPTELAEIHPDLSPPADIDRIGYFPTEGYVDVPVLVATLIRGAQSHGARILTGQHIDEIVQESGHVVGVRTKDGETIAADVVVSCAGRWTDQVTALTGVPIPMAPTLGLLVTSSPAPIGLRSLAHSPSINVRPSGGSRVMMASYQVDRVLRDDLAHADLSRFAQQVLARATEILPALAGSVVDTFRLAVRAIPRDGFPVVGPINGVGGFYVVSTHSGVTLGPLLGRIAAREIVSGDVDDRVTTFRPDRLVVVEAARE